MVMVQASFQSNTGLPALSASVSMWRQILCSFVTWRHGRDSRSQTGPSLRLVLRNHRARSRLTLLPDFPDSVSQ